MLCKGKGGSLEVLDDAVIIHRSTLNFLLGFTNGLKGDKRIPYSSITAVQFKRNGFMDGYIQFTLAGGIESRGGVLAASRDENSVCFDNNELFERARELIEKRIAIRTTAPALVVQSAADQLDKLAGLVDRGLLTKEEFEEQKRVLLQTVSRPPVFAEKSDEAISPRSAGMHAAMERAIADRATSQKTLPPTSAAPTFGKR
jgi:Short C-terminal domain/Domain of unknown function (DUF4429)